MAEVSDAELSLIIEALEDASYYRDTRSRVLDSAVRRQARRSSSASELRPADDEHRQKARAYSALAVRLKAAQRRRPS